MPTTSAVQSHAEAVLLRSDADGIATLTLNRPEQFNALSEELLDSLQTALDSISNDDTVRVVVIAANGKGFCAGHDFKEMRARPEQSYYQALFRKCNRMMLSIMRLPQPVIAKVQGMATAAGCQLVASSDLAIAAESARFGVSGINLGIFCFNPSVQLSRNISRKRAFELLATGKFIDAATASRYGLINDVVAMNELGDAVTELAETLNRKPPDALRLGKKVFYDQLTLGIEDALTLAGDSMACNMMYPDTVEGIEAFLSKRDPRWHWLNTADSESN